MTGAGFRAPARYVTVAALRPIALQVDYTTFAIVFEELARGWMGLAGILGAHLVLTDVLARYGTDDQKQRFLPRLAGGNGYSKDFPVERFYRDAPLLLIGGGSNEIQLLIIARGLLERYAVR